MRGITLRLICSHQMRWLLSGLNTLRGAYLHKIFVVGLSVVSEVVDLVSCVLLLATIHQLLVRVRVHRLQLLLLRLLLLLHLILLLFLCRFHPSRYSVLK